jgi:hypothetical protein
MNAIILLYLLKIYCVDDYVIIIYSNTQQDASNKLQTFCYPYSKTQAKQEFFNKN